MQTSVRRAAAALLATVLSAGGVSAAPTGSVERCASCGTVRSVEPVSGDGEASGKGALIGAVIGGVVGHQFGSGRGQDAATAAGAVGGAAAGHHTEKRMDKGTHYLVIVDLEAGGSKAVKVAETNGLSAGDKVRVNGSNLERLGR